MKRKLSFLLVLVFAISLLLPQNIFADDETEEDTYRLLGGLSRSGIVLLGGPQAASDTSIKVSWLDRIGYKGYKLYWKLDEEGASQDSVALKPTKDNSYVIKGLEPGKKYEIKIRGIVQHLDSDKYTDLNDSLHGVDYGYTYVCQPSYAKYTRMSSKDFIEMTWNVHEKDARLQIYRADTEDGLYTQIADISGTENKEQELKKYGKGQIDFKDESVEAGKTYYYKAKSVLQTENGTMESDFSSPVVFEAKNMKDPLFTTKMINKKGTYSKQITWKLTSDETNYKASVGPYTSADKLGTLYTFNSSNGKRVKRTIQRMEYSFDGKKYSAIKPGYPVSLEPGKSLYVRITMKSKIWIRKDGKGYVNLHIRDAAPNYQYLLYFDHDIDLHFDGTNQVNTKPVYDDYDSDDQKGYLEKFLELPKDGAGLYLWGGTLDSRTAVAFWDLVPGAKKYAVKYGKTREEAIKSEPVVVPAYQVIYKLEGLEENSDYYILVTDIREGEPDDFYSKDRTEELQVRVASRPMPVVS